MFSKPVHRVLVKCARRTNFLGLQAEANMMPHVSTLHQVKPVANTGLRHVLDLGAPTPRRPEQYLEAERRL